MDALLGRGYTVMLETGGHRPIARVPSDVIKIVDVKCPGSGESDKNHWENLDALAPHDEVKFVIKDRADYEFARDVIARHDLPSRVGGRAAVAGARRARSADCCPNGCSPIALPARLQLQLHKFIWSPETRGASDATRRRSAERRLDSYTAAAIATRRGLHAVRADHPLRPAPRPRSRGGAAGGGGARRERHLELPLDLRGIGGSALTSRRPVPRTAISPQVDIPSTYVPARNTIFLSLALGWAEVLGATRSVHRRQRARLLRLSRLPAGVHRRVRALAALATRAGVEGRALPHPHAAHHAVEGGDHPARPRARPRLRADAQLLRPRHQTGSRAAAATAACCAREGFAEAGVSIRSRSVDRPTYEP